MDSTSKTDSGADEVQLVVLELMLFNQLSGSKKETEKERERERERER